MLDVWNTPNLKRLFFFYTCWNYEAVKSMVTLAVWMQGKDVFVITLYSAGGVFRFENVMTAVILNDHIWLIHVHMK